MYNNGGLVYVSVEGPYNKFTVSLQFYKFVSSFDSYNILTSIFVFIASTLRFLH